MERRELAIEVALAHAVGIYNRHPPDACAAELLGGIGAHAAQPNNQHMTLRQTVHPLLSEE